MTTDIAAAQPLSPARRVPRWVWALLVLSLALNLMRSLRADPRQVPWPSIAMAGVLIGMLRATNTWDFPPYAAIVVMTMLLGSVHGVLRLDRRSIQTLIVCVVVFGVVTQVSFWPYLQRYQLFYTGVDPVRARTALSQYLTIHGLFLFLASSLLVWYLVRRPP